MQVVICQVNFDGATIDPHYCKMLGMGNQKLSERRDAKQKVVDDAKNRKMYRGAAAGNKSEGMSTGGGGAANGEGSNTKFAKAASFVAQSSKE